MGEFFFVIKTMILTVLLILLLQIKIGQTTLEQRSLNWMHESIAIDALRSVADGAVTVASEGYSWARATYDSKVNGKEHKSARGTRKDKQKEVNTDDNVDLD